MRASIEVGKIIGIPIRLHFTFLFVLPLFVLALADSPYIRGLPTSFIEIVSPFLRYSFSTIAVLLLFASVLFHEVSHSYFAKKYGAKIDNITLFIFGGIAMIEDIPKDPKKELKIAIAGPAMSFAIGISLILVYLIISKVAIYRPFQILLFSIGFLNILLGSFNLIPAFPMDGGRILRSFFARRWRFIKATKRAALIGKILAVVMGISGAIADPFVFILKGKIGMNLWTVIIAFILYIGASEEEKATITHAALEGTKVENVMKTEIMSIPMDMTIAEVVEEMLKDKTLEYAVSDSGYIKGFITFEEIKELPTEKRPFLKVGNVVRPGNVTVSKEEGTIEAQKKMIRHRRNILVVEENDNFIGVVTKRDLASFIEISKEKES